ncbi:hypothetical protein SAMN05421858_5080 [Haladaptatus litoreus]|uniref:Uncharacterized protein n=1 Tax=Haladaptatus litoreus TaxID=553468 RepID=A0A1N7FI21_9EURY|nr:hypothetical protein [Haladaptatus litoreus]SIR99934.1 hypothetical protein SAMN05421858_5080 [Haladaptatus litoreus]
MSQKQKTTTVHGDVEYETVECSSCGNEVAKSQACYFVIGEKTNHLRSRNRVNFKNGYITGWACQYCADGPVGFPEAGSVRERVMKWFYSLDNDERGFILMFATMSLSVPIAVILENI